MDVIHVVITFANINQSLPKKNACFITVANLKSTHCISVFLLIFVKYQNGKFGAVKPVLLLLLRTCLRNFRPLNFGSKTDKSLHFVC